MIDPQKARGERVRRTVFFSDMRGFTKMSEQRPPDDTLRTLGRCLRLQAGIVQAYQGRLDKFVGDSVVAVFDGDGMALDAVQCAIDIQAALRKENTAHSDEPELNVGIGIVTGELVMGNVGSDDPSEFTVVGSNVRLCSRLCNTAGPHEILIDKATHQEVQARIEVGTEESITVRGFPSPVPVYKVMVV